MSKQPLTPTQIVDRNGRQTTVHRKTMPAVPAPVDRLAGVTPVLPVTGGESSGARTPLTPPPPMSEDDYRMFLSETDGYDIAYSRRFSPEEARLAARILDGPAGDVLYWLTNEMSLRSVKGQRIPHFDYDAMLVFERVARDAGAEVLHGKSYLVMSLMRGLSYAEDPSECRAFPRLRCEEDLDGCAAQVRFCLSLSSDELDEIAPNQTFTTTEGISLAGRALAVPALGVLLRERPADCEAIIEYAKTRGVPATAEQAEALRDYLGGNESARVLRGGWL